MLQAASAPAHNDLHPQRKIKLQKLMKNRLVMLKEMAKGDSR